MLYTPGQTAVAASATNLGPGTATGARKPGLSQKFTTPSVAQSYHTRQAK